MKARVVLVGLCVAGAVAGCAPVGDPSIPGTSPPAVPGGPGGTSPTTTTPPTGEQPFELYTHCGIHELRVDGRFFARVGGPLTDGSGNPPAGWGNPYQPGRLAVTGDVAVFTDDRGHREMFRVREGATEFLRLCA